MGAPSAPKSAALHLGLLARARRALDPARLQELARARQARSPLRAAALRQLAVLVFALGHLRANGLARDAAALTYNTLLSLVPVLALSFALFQAFGGEQRLEETLFNLIIENIAIVRPDEVRHWLRQFIQNTNSGAIAGIGAVLLIYSALALMSNVERSFNHTWEVSSTRPLRNTLIIYWAILTLTPPLVAASFSITSALEVSWVAKMVARSLPWGIGEWLFSLASVLVVCLALTLSYLVIPNARVRARSALFGGLLAGLLWSVSKVLYVWATARSVRYNVIYGALGVLPLLMIWLYLSWIVVLLGMAYTVGHQKALTGLLEHGTLELSSVGRERLAARVLLDVARRFDRGEPPPTIEDLAEATGASSRAVREVLAPLEEHLFLVRAAEHQTARYLPGRSLQALTLDQVIALLQQPTAHDRELPPDPAYRQVDELIAQAGAAKLQVLSGITLSALSALSAVAAAQDRPPRHDAPPR